MPTLAIIGAQWGDEGKGKIVDLLAGRAQMVVRFSGGNNAGHTVINPQGEFRLHLVPSGICHPDITCVIGNGVVVDPATLFEEIDGLKAKGVTVGRLFVSDRAHLIMPYHILQDRLEERARGGKAIGTTGRGIGPAFADKVARQGLRVGDLLDDELLRERLGGLLEQKNRVLTGVYEESALSFDEVYAQLRVYAERLAPFIADTSLLVDEALDRGDLVLLEGAQGTMLDIDFGTYPYVTSSACTVTAACQGLGLAPHHIGAVVGVTKAYTTRVGGGPFPTELEDETGQLIRETGHEYGTTTGRPRRCGWFDAVVVRHAVRLNGFTSLALMRLDVLSALPELKVCLGYEVDGQRIDHFPANLRTLERCRPIYKTMPGWQTDIGQARRFIDLPPQAQDYVRCLEETTGCPAGIVSVGAHREETIIQKL